MSFFGTDGVRGRVGEPPMTPDILTRLGFVAGRVLADEYGADVSQVLISKDTRLSGYMVESALEAGFAAAGVNVLLSGPLPTSAVSYLTQTLRLAAGVVISGSHNPHYDNGVKFFGADGLKLSDAMQSKIADGMQNNDALCFEENPGRAFRLDAAADRYIEFCKRAFPQHMRLHGTRLLVDCANGATYHVAPHVLHELGADVVEFACAPDGVNINVECGVMHPWFAAKAVLENKAAAGILLDGDGDRVFVVDENGKIHDGDAILYLLATWHAKQKLVSGVVGTRMSNLALELELQKQNIAFARADVGDRNVLRELLARDWLLGGESSGHIVLRDLHCTGDGIIAALQVLAIMCESGKALSQLLADYHPLPQHQQSVRVQNREAAIRHENVVKAMAAVEQQLGERGRLVVRASGTENVIRVMAESESANTAKNATQQVADALQAAL